MKKLILLAAFTLNFGFWTLPGFAQYTKLLDFAGTTNGRDPYGSLVSDGTFLCGMTKSGGANSLGTIFKIKPDGTGYAKLLDFAGASNGSNPNYTTLITDGTFLYGMTTRGGTSNFGTLFKIRPDGTGYVKLLDFVTATGRNPDGSLLYDGTFLYGMTGNGGTNNGGTIFKIMPDGSGFVKLLDFAGATNGRGGLGSLISDGTFLYGMTQQGGTNDQGTVFKIMPNGTGYMKLLDFIGTNGNIPQGSLISDGTFLYGMTESGGTNGDGVIFKIKPDGTGYVDMLDFAGTSNGSNPFGNLISDGTFLYGMTESGGTNDDGVIFKIKPDGSGYVKLIDFARTTTGQSPLGTFISDGAFLYGMTAGGGANDMGTIFKYALPVAVPTITNFTPASAPVGSTLTISGTNFSTTPANNIVYLGATKATVTAATSTQLTVVVPVGATYQPFTVSVGGLTAHAPRPFVVTFAGGGNVDACSWGPQVNLGTNTGTVSRPVIGDVDGDGKPDLITTDFNNDIVSIRRNISTPGTITVGSFESPVDLASGNSPLGAAFGDLDSDGKPDLAVINYLGGQLSVFKNLSTPGTIAFAPKVDFPVPTFVADAQIADIDGDGKQDLTITHFAASGLMVLRNTGTPGVINASSFAAGVTFSTGPNPYPFAMGDIDGDGKLDAAVPNGNQHSVSVLRNTSTPGSVSFATQIVLITAPGTPVVGQGAFFASLGDLDGDNKLDLAVTNNTTFDISLFRNTSTLGSLSFDPKIDLLSTAASAYPRLSDLDGDGKVDLAVDVGTNTFAIYKNTGTPGTIAFNLPIAFPKTGISSQLLAGDIDGDGRNDIISCSDNVLVFRNLIGTISPPTITSFTPTGGPVGTLVTITGTNFSTPFSNTVAFNGTAASITGSTATTLTVTVPAGATTGAIQVTIGCNTVNSSNFTVGFLPITITTQPSAVTTCAGNMATFTTAATGTTNITYQWQFSTTLTGTYNDIANEGGYSNVATASLSVNTTGNFGAGFYRARVNGDLAIEVITNQVELSITPDCDNEPPVILTTTSSVPIEGIVTVNLLDLISDPDDNLDLSTLTLLTSVSQQGASASINSSSELVLDYGGVLFFGTDNVTIQVCDLSAACSQQELTIEVGGDIEIFNAISPNGDGQNDFLYLKYIELFTDTQQNHVTLYNRWGDVVFEIDNYDNDNRVFRGLNKNDKELPSGTYYYKIEFSGGRKTQTGYLSLKR